MHEERQRLAVTAVLKRQLYRFIKITQIINWCGLCFFIFSLYVHIFKLQTAQLKGG